MQVLFEIQPVFQKPDRTSQEKNRIGQILSQGECHLSQGKKGLPGLSCPEDHPDPGSHKGIADRCIRGQMSQQTADQVLKNGNSHESKDCSYDSVPPEEAADAV